MRWDLGKIQSIKVPTMQYTNFHIVLQYFTFFDLVICYPFSQNKSEVVDTVSAIFDWFCEDRSHMLHLLLGLQNLSKHVGHYK